MGGVSRRIVSAGVIVLAMGMVLSLVSGARAASVEPTLFEHDNVFCTAPTENQTGLGLALVAKFGNGQGEFPLVDGESSGGGVTVDLDVDGGTVLSWDSGDIPIGAVIVKGGDDTNVYFYDGDTGDENLVTPLNNGGNRPALSHVDFCAAPEEDEVDVQVVLGTCDFTDSTTPVDVTISGDGTATVVIKDADDEVVATFTESGSTDLSPGTYSYETTPGEGSALTEGSDESGTLVALDCAVGGAGSLVVDVGACEFEDGKSKTPFDVTIAPAGAGSLTLTGNGVARTFTGEGGSLILGPGTYNWTSNAADGFTLRGDRTGSVTAKQCAKVGGVRTDLPTTGTTSRDLGIVGGGLLLLGWAIRFGGERRLAHERAEH